MAALVVLTSGPPAAWAAPPTPPPQPAPTVEPTPTPGGLPPTIVRFIPFTNLKERLVEALNDWLLDAAEGFLEPASEAIRAAVFDTPPLDDDPRLRDLWGRSRAVAAALLILGVTVAGVLLMTAATFDWHYPARQLLTRLVAAGVFANLSLIVTGFAIDLNNALVAAILGGEPSGVLIRERLVALAASSATVHPLVVAVFGILLAGLAMLVLVVSVARVAVLALVIVTGPLALAGYALPQTAGVASLWWRVLLAAVFVQFLQALVLVLGAQVLVGGIAGGGAIVDALVLATLLYVVVKLPFSLKDAALQGRPLPFSGAVGGAAKLVVIRHVLRRWR